MDTEGFGLNTEGIRLKTLFVALLSVAILEILGANVGRLWNFPALVVLGCLRLLDIGILIIIVIRFEAGVLRIGMDSGRIPAGIKKGAFWSLAVGCTAAALALILNYGSDVNPFKLIKAPLPKGISEIILYFIVGGIIGPIAEEIFFRGLIFLYFRRLGFIPALILSTTLFVLLHPLSSGIPLPQIVGGLLFATALEIEKSLMVPIVIHISGNLSIFTISWLSVQSFI